MSIIPSTKLVGFIAASWAGSTMSRLRLAERLQTLQEIFSLRPHSAQDRALPYKGGSLRTGRARHGMMSSAASGGPRVLVVDDEESILDFVEMGLRYEGFEVERELDGPAALAAIERRRPDLVVLDLNLPGLDGLEVCRQIRRRSDLPIIMLTARGDVDERVEGLEAGADDYLPKPFK
ncbi:MAG TPA: response regulator, partial [Mycobacteriales bacterium]|nr:response regulator [Mycobacteriales bacterium]